MPETTEMTTTTMSGDGQNDFIQEENLEEVENDEGDILDGKLHPLLIDHVIEKISRYLLHEEEDQTVMDSRLVCQVWDRIATRSLRFHSNKTVYFGKYFRSPQSLLEFSSYLKLSLTQGQFPIGKFYLCEDVFQQNHLHTVQTFFRDCSSLLTSLTLRLDNQSDLKVSDMDFANLQLSNLKSLSVDERRLIISSSSENDPTIVSSCQNTFLEGLVKSSPNLERLTVIHLPSSIFDDDETASSRRHASEKNVAQMLGQNCPKHLRYLNLDIKLNDKVLVILSELPAVLQELQLSLRESDFSKESLNKLLVSQKESLRSLRFCSMGAKSHFEIEFPILPSLTLLELHSWESQIHGVTMSKFSYCQNFPSINSLILHTWAENPGFTQFFPAAYYGTVPSLRNLKLPQNFMYPAMIQNLSWLYPNLKRLDVHFSKETVVIIRRIFSHLDEHLEELKIRGSLPREKCDFCLDPLFTGLSQSVCDKILRRRMFGYEVLNRSDCQKLRERPNLLHLKNLRKLDIDDMLRHETYVTDVTGYLILLQMPSLRYLLMGRSQIDDECLRQLAEKYPNNMEKELLVPKRLPQRNLTTLGMIALSTPASFLLTGAGSSMVGAYNYCFPSYDLPNICVIS